MYDLYIQVEDGKTVNHPAFASNLLQYYPSIPDNWQPFIRIAKPTPDTYQVVFDEPTYELINGVWTDVWSIRDMTEDEKSEVNSLLNRKVEAYRKIILDQANQHLASATLDNVKTAWANYIAKITSYTVLDITNPKFPAGPLFDSNGNLLTNKLSGSAPNVIS